MKSQRFREHSNASDKFKVRRKKVEEKQEEDMQSGDAEMGEGTRRSMAFGDVKQTPLK